MRHNSLDDARSCKFHIRSRGQPDEKWATGIIRANDRAEMEELLECSYMNNPNKNGYSNNINARGSQDDRSVGICHQ